MASLAPKDLPTAVAQGDLAAVENLLNNGADMKKRSKDGMAALALAAFWGYADIVQVLLKAGDDVNAVNRGTNWTPLHCAAFQGHGPCIMRLLEYKPNIHMKDMRGRTAVDFASAHDGIWPFFAAAGCPRTSSADLAHMDINQETFFASGGGDRTKGYEFMSDSWDRARDPNMEVAAITGDVLADNEEGPHQAGGIAGLHVYQ